MRLDALKKTRNLAKKQRFDSASPWGSDHLGMGNWMPRRRDLQPFQVLGTGEMSGTEHCGKDQRLGSGACALQNLEESPQLNLSSCHKLLHGF